MCWSHARHSNCWDHCSWKLQFHIQITWKWYCVDSFATSSPSYPLYSPDLFASCWKFAKQDLWRNKLISSWIWTNWKLYGFIIRKNHRRNVFWIIFQFSASRSDVKLKLDVNGFNFDQCSNIYEKSSIKLSNKQLCAGGEEGKGTCNGDSGDLIDFWIGTDSNNMHSVTICISFIHK